MSASCLRFLSVSGLRLVSVSSLVVLVTTAPFYPAHQHSLPPARACLLPKPRRQPPGPAAPCYRRSGREGGRQAQRRASMAAQQRGKRAGAAAAAAVRCCCLLLLLIVPFPGVRVSWCCRCPDFVQQQVQQHVSDTRAPCHVCGCINSEFLGEKELLGSPLGTVAGSTRN